MSNINSIPSSAGVATAALGSNAFSPLQAAFQSTLKSLQSTPLRSRLVLQMAGQVGPASPELLRQQISRDCGYHPAI
ncbi:MAG: hypothetical protein QE278_12455 [Limnobacter sp.]|nr:hypothetical protein [Limnobacter sp.]